ncbi:MAG: signal peptidase I [Cyanobacteria bacterium]|nr:signal peptidase I [Cyanobacteriota bacterium]
MKKIDKNIPIDPQMPEKSRTINQLKEILYTAFLTAIMLLFLRGTVAEARYIPSGSMEPTLKINDRILVEKLSTKLGNVNRGDIVVFYPPAIEIGDATHIVDVIGGLPFCPGTPTFVKRVVGIPGDIIEMRKGIGLAINGTSLDESEYIKEPANYDLKALGDIGGYSAQGKLIRPYGDSNKAIVVPPNHVFVLGDNRNNSADGHVWGFLPKDRIVGKSCLFMWRDSWLSLTD